MLSQNIPLRFDLAFISLNQTKFSMLWKITIYLEKENEL